MSTYICEKCGCVDNSACDGNYWTVISKRNAYKDDYANKNLLCSECTPQTYKDGSKNEDAGKWHNKFIKRHWEECGTKEELIAISKKGHGSYVNAEEYFEKLKQN